MHEPGGGSLAVRSRPGSASSDQSVSKPGAAQREHLDLVFEDSTLQEVLNELTRMFLADVQDPVSRHVLEGASVIRRSTVPLLAALFPELAPQQAYERLRDLPFVDASPVQETPGVREHSCRGGRPIHSHSRILLMAALQAGTPAPDFSLASHSGQTVSLSSFRGRRMVVAFLPLAFTGG